jgi:hypothetical protein
MKLARALSFLLIVTAAGCSEKGGTTPTPTACSYSLAASAQSAPAGGGSFAVTVTKTSGSCSWTASSDASWITFSGAATGTDTGTLNYAVASNTGTASRTGTVSVSWTGAGTQGSTQVVVTQAGMPTPPPGACAFIVAPTAQSAPVEGGSFAMSVTTSGTECAWTASADVPWITITSGASGLTTGTVMYSAAANPESNVRTGTITVQWATGSATLTVSEAPLTNCAYTLSPSRQDVPAAGGSGFTFTATRNTPTGCSWSATTTAPWITLTGGTTGASPGIVPYAVAANTDPSARAGTIRVIWSGGSADFVVNQAASAPAFQVSFSLFDPGRQTVPTTECQIRSATVLPTTCTLTATASLPTAIVSYDWLVQYPYGFQRILPQTGPGATFSFQESCGQFSASDAGTVEALSVQLTVTDAVGNTATVRSNAGNQPALSIRFFTCGL